jgi:hypothetical protein
MNADELRWSIDWVLSLDTPPMPQPSGWRTDVEWCNYWREQRGRVLRALEAATKVDAVVTQSSAHDHGSPTRDSSSPSCPSCLSLQARVIRLEEAKDRWKLRSDIEYERAVKAEALVTTLQEEKAEALADPAEQRAERFALEAYDLAGRLSEAESSLRSLRASIEAFLKKWPEVEKRINGLFGLQYARTGVQYDGPTIGAEIEAMRAAILTLSPSVPATATPSEEEQTERQKDTRMDRQT